MGLMYVKRRQDAKKAHEAQKAKAHAENHKTAKANAQKAANGSDKPGTK